jgi:hypothetical protein
MNGKQVRGRRRKNLFSSALPTRSLGTHFDHFLKGYTQGCKSNAAKQSIEPVQDAPALAACLSLTMKSLSATWITPASLGVCRTRCNEPNCSSYRLSESKRYPRIAPCSCSACLMIGRGIGAQLRHGFAANKLPRYP